MSEKLTVNEAITLLNTLKGRASELRGLRGQVATKDHWFGDKEKVVEPQYDVIKVDEKVVQLENQIYKLDAHIKSINAKTKIEIDVDVDGLLAPLPRKDA